MYLKKLAILALLQAIPVGSVLPMFSRFSIKMGFQKPATLLGLSASLGAGYYATKSPLFADSRFKTKVETKEYDFGPNGSLTVENKDPQNSINNGNVIVGINRGIINNGIMVQTTGNNSPISIGGTQTHNYSKGKSTMGTSYQGCVIGNNIKGGSVTVINNGNETTIINGQVVNGVQTPQAHVAIIGNGDKKLKLEITTASPDDMECAVPEITVKRDYAEIRTVYKRPDCNARLSYKLTLPSSTTITDINTDSSSVDVENMDAPIKTIGTASGSIAVKKVKAAIQSLSSDSGSITAENIESIRDVSTVSGRQKLRNIQSNIEQLSAISGNITIQDVNGNIGGTSTIKGNQKFKNISGSIQAIMSISGAIKAEDIKGGINSIGTVSGDINSKNCKVRYVQTVSGKVRPKR